MNTLTHIRPVPVAPFEWTPFDLLRPYPSPLRVEERVDEKAYTLRVEVPGVDPAHDIVVTYHAGTLRLVVRREDTRAERTHTEFRYGTYERFVPLPVDTDGSTIAATYKDGILEITATRTDSGSDGRTIPVTVEPAATDA